MWEVFSNPPPGETLDGLLEPQTKNIDYVFEMWALYGPFTLKVFWTFDNRTNAGTLRQIRPAVTSL